MDTFTDDPYDDQAGPKDRPDDAEDSLILDSGENGDLWCEEGRVLEFDNDFSFAVSVLAASGVEEPL